ncbi:MAG: ComEC/Rec2 family competence protein, partial [Alphaproteobacteria bacterium]|nr:ComEC/Rec2 family competence protein [Alphaproteobacteria bacterium]
MLEAQRERWPLWLPVMLGVGIGVYFALRFEPPLWSGWVGAAVFAGIAWRAAARGRTLAFLGAVAVTTLAVGFALAGARTWWLAAPVLDREIGPVTVTGQVARVEPTERGRRVTLERLTIPRLSPDRVPRAVRVALYGTEPDVRPGDWLEVRAELSPPPPPAMPGAFDFQRQSYFQGLGGVGFAYGAPTVVGGAPDAGADSLAFAWERGRTAISERILRHEAGETGAVTAALMMGERGAIPEDVLEAMRASGLAHLLAISGLHVGLVAGIVFFAVRALGALVPPL